MAGDLRQASLGAPRIHLHTEEEHLVFQVQDNYLVQRATVFGLGRRVAK